MRHSKTRRFAVGHTGECSEIRYRVIQGAKKPGDLVLQLYVNGRWQRIRMELGFLLAAFFFENEEVLYPPSGSRHIGGDYYMRECWDAIYYGWESAAQKLRKERAARIQRLEFAGLTPDETANEYRYPRLNHPDRTFPRGKGR